MLAAKQMPGEEACRLASHARVHSVVGLILEELQVVAGAEQFVEALRSAHSLSCPVNRKEVVPGGKHESRLGSKQCEDILVFPAECRHSRPYLLSVLGSAAVHVHFAAGDKTPGRCNRHPWIGHHQQRRHRAATAGTHYSDPGRIHLSAVAEVVQPASGVVQEIPGDRESGCQALRACVVMFYRAPVHRRPADGLLEVAQPLALSDGVLYEDNKPRAREIVKNDLVVRGVLCVTVVSRHVEDRGCGRFGAFRQIEVRSYEDAGARLIDDLIDPERWAGDAPRDRWIEGSVIVRQAAKTLDKSFPHPVLVALNRLAVTECIAHGLACSECNRGTRIDVLLQLITDIVTVVRWCYALKIDDLHVIHRLYS